MTYDYITTVVVMDVAGRSSWFNADGYTAEGGRVLGDATSYCVASNSVRAVIFEPDLTGNWIGNGWVRLAYPSNRELLATSRITSYRDRELGAMSSAVKPSSDFRFYGVRWDGEETGISIVNPTSHEQTVTIRLHQWKDGSLVVIENTWEIAPMNRLSRFLSELVPLGDYADNSGNISGLVHVQRGTQIAVGALNFSRDTEFFGGIPVSAEPSE